MTSLINGYTILKSAAIAYVSYGALDHYRLCLGHDNTYRVHLERLEANGTVSEGIIYDGSDLEAANKVYYHYTEGK